ncbi:MAG: TauD/TfdA family dioxygenase [Verrucomicrobiota bacterium]
MTKSIIDHPCVWHGEELLERDEWLHTFTSAEIGALDDIVTTGEARDANPVVQRLCFVREKLETGAGGCMMRGIPVQRYTEKETTKLFALLAGKVGTLLSQSATGETVFSVRDAGFKDDDPRSRGPNTRKKLSFHSDRCDVIAFLCLKQAKEGGENEVVSSAAIFNEMARTRPDLLEILRTPFYYLRHTVDTGNEKPWTQQPIFSVHEGHFACNLLRVLIERAYANPDLPDMTREQREALDAVEEIANRPEFHVRFRQRPGDMLFLNNWVTLHRRSEFIDHEQPEEKRHILRIWLSVPNSRPLDPLFAGNYGATEAGALRGGMRAAQ